MVNGERCESEEKTVERIRRVMFKDETDHGATALNKNLSMRYLVHPH